MPTESDLRYLGHRPFFTFFSNLLDARFFASEHSEPVRILEIGCGPGEFAHMLKQKYGNKVDIVAIDPGDNVALAQKNYSSNGVEYKQATVEDIKEDASFDVCLFSKSLHHCMPLHETVVKTHALLKQHGVCVAEELDRDQVNSKTATWFSDRLDLLRLGGLIFDKTPEEHEAQGDSEELCAHMFDVSKPGYDRLREFYKDHLVNEELHTLPIIMDELYKSFGEKNVKVASVIPFLHEFLIFLG
ncbi:S-adenosyl-L-methionine-dependent methyltransferase [Syncephalastrum racemosum]|uniref:S-adenosyl-L-methionine-dependent methyltransferase n=1 Tax=Syncephalastrum racemosum TaxID=13706 RepID=A0A1X2HR75_SYNRA|nr:S-adenosyl-L-methionine-dependent methyltransferase [Syncephalastrum racemosum]